MNLGLPGRKHLFWSADIDHLNIEKHKKYIIHQALQYGELSDLKWLKSIYSEDELKTVFVEQPRKTYQAKTFHFVKNFILHIANPLDSGLYVSTIS